jgi:predicted phage tail component-like protein
MIRSYDSFDWFEFNGLRSDDFNTVIKNLTVISRPDKMVQRVSVPGRDGDLTISDDTYGTIPVTISCMWEKDISLDRLNQWLSGKGDLILSYKPDRRYKAEITGVIGVTNKGAYLQSDVTLTVQPFDYEATPEIIELTSSQTIINPGTRWSLPKITVYGAGTLTIGDYTLVVTSTGGEGYIIIDSEIGECYYGSSNRGSKVSGGFPKLNPGEVEVTIGAGITKIEIQGNWRWF